MTSYAEVMGTPPREKIVTEREKTIGVRVTPAELEELQRAAELRGMKVASFLRMLGLTAARERKE